MRLFKFAPQGVDKLKKEYAIQNNRATAYPIYVTVQELVCIGVMANGYSANCPYGDGVTRIEYKQEAYENTFESKQELIDIIKEDYSDDPHIKIESIEEINLGYIWKDVEFFLTIKGAEEYMQANKHNHGKLRTYVHHFERRNFEMRNLLKAIGFKVKD